ncbi:hypothetical protein [Gloeobacter kilaueensis]|uniref:hypothetical protein n=1 Tax=Gloeobacter kilaueensis TaxID=1416614 RepID=UPI0004249DE2|nr:hypothetical protein [Gloeobacter kilaueensis]
MRRTHLPDHSKIKSKICALATQLLDVTDLAGSTGRQIAQTLADLQAPGNVGDDAQDLSAAWCWSAVSLSEARIAKTHS